MNEIEKQMELLHWMKRQAEALEKIADILERIRLDA